jgi:hypothetical protein
MLARTVKLCLLLTLIMGCGKRGLPPSPDRWAPKLAGVRAVDRNHVDLFFSEKMDRTAAARRQSYVAVDLESETLKVHSSHLLSNGQTIRLTTETQNTIEYSIFVSRVTDAAGNEVRPGSMKSFKGSSERDTTRPQVREIYPADGSVGVPADSALLVSFSETMDTSSVSLAGGSVIVLPPPADSALRWNEEMSEFFLPILALTSHKASLHLTRGCRDYGGNSLRTIQRSVFTTEDSMHAGIISGTVAVPEGLYPFLSSVGIFDSLWSPLILDYAGDSTGSFTFTHLKDGKYLVAAARDTDGDGDFDLRGASEILSIQEGEALQGLRIDLKDKGDLESEAENSLLNFHRMNFIEAGKN